MDVHTTIARCAGDADTPDEPTLRYLLFRHGGRDRQAADSRPPAANAAPVRLTAGPEKLTHPTALGKCDRVAHDPVDTLRPRQNANR